MIENVVFMNYYLHEYHYRQIFAGKKKTIMKKFLFLLPLLTWPLHSVSQISSMMNNLRNITVKASLADSKTGEPVSYAAVWLTERGDTAIVSYAISDDAGRVTIDGVRQGKYDVHIEMMGYESFVKSCDIKVNEFEQERNLGRILLNQSDYFLDAVTVSATATPVKVKKDTIEYNASAYHVVENAKLGDLLKKMPGIKVANDGTVKVNGEKIDKITMDGKTMFMKDPSMAIRNLPANIVDKVQVIDRTKDDATFTGIGTKDDQEKILDLQLKDEYNQGWFGNLKLSGGASLLSADELKENGQGKLLFNNNVMVSHYTPQDQLILISTAMNAPEPGSMNIDDMDFQMEGMEEGALAGKQGLNTSVQTGLNYNTAKISGFESSLNVNHNYNSKTVNEKSVRTSFVKDNNNILTDNAFTGNGNSNSLNMSLELKNTDMSRHLFAFRPYLYVARRNTQTGNESRTSTAGIEDNHSNSLSSDKTDNISYFSELELGMRNLGKEGRSLTLTNEMMFDNSDGTTAERSVTYIGGTSERLDLDYANKNITYMPELELSYAEPLGKDWALQLRASGRYTKSQSDKKATDLNDASRSDYYSSYSRNEDIDSRQRFLMQYKKNDVSLLFGLQVNEEMNITKTRHLGVETEVGKGEWIFNWAPFVDYQFKSDLMNARLNYSGRSTTPSGSRIIPTLNMNNPVQIEIGNAYLRPQFTHNLSFTFKNSNPDDFSFYELYIDGSVRKNQIVTASWFDAQGIRYSIPVNSKDLGVNVWAYLSYSKPFGKDDNFTLTLDGDASLERGSGYQAKGALQNIDKDHFSYSGLMKWLWNDGTEEKFYSGKSGFVTSSSRTVSFSLFPGLTYRQDFLSLSAMGFASHSLSHYTVDSFNDVNTWDFGIDFEEILTTKRELELYSDISYAWYKGYSEGFGTPELIWNAGISKNLGKFALSLKVADILNQKKSLHRTTAPDYVEDVNRTVMGRYFLLGVSFNFGKMNASQSEQVERAMWEMQW